MYLVAASSDQKTKISLNVFAKSHGGFCSDEILVLSYEQKFSNHSFHVKYHPGFANFFMIFKFKYTGSVFSFLQGIRYFLADNK